MFRDVSPIGVSDTLYMNKLPNTLHHTIVLKPKETWIWRCQSPGHILTRRPRPARPLAVESGSGRRGTPIAWLRGAARAGEVACLLAAHPFPPPPRTSIPRLPSHCAAPPRQPLASPAALAAAPHAKDAPKTERNSGRKFGNRNRCLSELFVHKTVKFRRRKRAFLANSQSKLTPKNLC